MTLLACPHCGLRDAAEFRYIDEQRERPQPSTVSAEQWRGYLYLRTNPAGWTSERWLHRAGCRRYFDLERNTLTGQTRP